jgi:hypothetical protein
MVLAERTADGEDVVLRGLGESIIQNSAQLVVEGRHYRTEDEARRAIAGAACWRRPSPP